MLHTHKKYWAARLGTAEVLPMTREEMDTVLDLRQFVGRAPEQVLQFISEEVDPFLERHKDAAALSSDVQL